MFCPLKMTWGEELLINPSAAHIAQAGDRWCCIVVTALRSTVCVLTSYFTDSRPHLTPFLRQLERATTGVCASRSMCRWTPPVPGPATHTHALGRHHAPTWAIRQRKPTSLHGCACMCTARALPCAHLPMPAAGESAHQAG